MKQPARNVKIVNAKSPSRVVRLVAVACAILVGMLLATSPGTAVAQATRASTAPVAKEASRASALAVGTATDYWAAVSRPRADAPAGGVGQPAAASTTSAGAFESTVYFRQMGDRKFNVVARFPKKTVALARWGGRAVVLLEGGQWVSVWQGGSGNGLPLPGGTPMITLGADDKDVWTLATLAGGIDAARKLAAAPVRQTTRATSRPTPTSTPTPTTSATASATTSASPEVATDLSAGTVLYRLNGQSWTPVAQLPVVIERDGRVTRASILAGGDGKVFVAVETATAGAKLFEIDAASGAVSPSLALPPGVSPALFADTRGDPLVWLRGGEGDDRGSVLSLADGGVGKAIGKISIASDASAAVTSALGFVRVLSPGEKPEGVVERRFTPELAAVGQPEPLATLPPPDEAAPWTNYTNVGVVVLMVLAILASYRHRDEVRLSLARKDRPRPARVWIRLCAATVDALPLLGGAAYIFANHEPGEYLPSTFAGTIPGLIAIGIYLLHTTVSELIWARTLGKWVFGLRVVNIKGERPGIGAILARNGLRVIDIALMVPFLLPVLLVIFSPFRQRPGDAAAGTMVVDIAMPTMVDELPEE